TKRDRTWLNKITFGKLGRSNTTDKSVASGEYNGATTTQMIRNAAQLRLAGTTTPPANTPVANDVAARNGISVGLGLP
ncbi:outer membrane protein assembly factor BamD, partial [Psychrobacter sp. SIMBA_152]